MGRFFSFVALAAISVVALADIYTLSLGEIAQYSASLVRENEHCDTNEY
jgi:hypothetical protein